MNYFLAGALGVIVGCLLIIIWSLGKIHNAIKRS